ncbi:probable aquaporin SIP1-1 at C-terminar half [Coccomyxa sp. Obi]|nr:probable aquaporin SIP1-1 at C-terminar half [Coccomyxa sp. Obi]
MANTAKRPAKPKALAKPQSTIRSALTDAIATAVFVFASSVFGEFAGILENKGVPPAVAGLGVLVAALIALDTFNQTFLGDGVLNNPSNALAFAAAGKGVVFSTATVRIGAQVAGGLAGAAAAINYIPKSWLRNVGELAEGVKPGVSLAAGAFCEFALAFVLNLAILYSMSTKRKLVGALTPLVITVVLVIAGSSYTGPSMNPAHAFSWNYFLDGHSRVQHITVFWVAPLAGALGAGLLWNSATAPATKAKKRKAPAKAPAKAAAKEKETKKAQ